VDGTLVNVGAFAPLQEVRGAGLLLGRRRLGGSLIGGVAETQEVVNYCAGRNIKADIEMIRPDQIAQAFDRVVKKDVRYRFVIDMRAGLNA
jgi:alcohol dehydrogenase (NADP+)